MLGIGKLKTKEGWHHDRKAESQGYRNGLLGQPQGVAAGKQDDCLHPRLRRRSHSLGLSVQRLERLLQRSGHGASGHGSSGGAGEQDVQAYVEWIKDAFAAFGIEKPILVGHSLGAAITLTFAIHYPELLSGIIAFGGGVKMPVNPAILEGIKKDMPAVLAMTAKIAVAKQNRERLAPILAKRSPKQDVLYGDFVACDRLDISEQVQGIKVPTLLICGTEDKMTPPALSESLKGMIPRAQLALIPEAGHMVMLEAPEAFNAAVKTFVDSLA